MGFAALFEGRTAAFISELDACADTHAAARRACSLMDELAEAFSVSEDDARVRARAVMLCRVAKSALLNIGAATEADVRAFPERPGPAKLRYKAVLGYAPGAIACVLAIWMYLSGNVNPAFLALLCAALSILAARERAGSTAKARCEITVRVNAREMSRHVAFLCREIDALLPEREMAERGAGPGAPLLEAVQMLMEAELAKDGAFALKSVPQLADALARDGVRFSRYEDGEKADFDLLPGPADGVTIRPSVRRNGELILRGQAMVKR